MDPTQPRLRLAEVAELVVRKRRRAGLRLRGAARRCCVDLPEANSPTVDVPEDEVVLVVTVDVDGMYFMNVGEAEEPVALSMVGERTKRILAANPGIQVLVEGDRNLSYGVVVNLMNVLQNAGATNVGLITEPPGE